MKAFVTGGTGVVGRTFVPKLLAAGWDVVSLTRDPTKPTLPRHPNLAYVAGDLDSPAVLPALAASGLRFDTVFHLAASLEYFGPRDRVFATNVGGTAAMVDFARKTGARRFVYASSVEAGGSFARHATPASDGNNGPTASNYGASKRAAEQVALAAGDLAPICLRIGNVYGPGWANFVVEFAQNLLHRGRIWEYLPVFGHRWISPVHNDDVAAGLLAAATSPCVGVANLVGEPASVEAIVRHAAAAMGVPFTCGRAKPLDGLYLFCTTRYLRKFGHCDTPAYLLAPRWPRVHRGFAPSDRYGWTPAIPLDAGVKSTLVWARSAGLLSF